MRRMMTDGESGSGGGAAREAKMKMHKYHRRALQKLLADDRLDYTPRGYGRAGQPPVISHTMAKGLLRHEHARVSRPDGRKIPQLRITRAGMWALRIEIMRETRRFRYDGD